MDYTIYKTHKNKAGKFVSLTLQAFRCMCLKQKIHWILTPLISIWTLIYPHINELYIKLT